MNGAAGTGMMPSMADRINPVDWTGVEPDDSTLAPLDAATFTMRLTRLSERAASLTALRRAFAEQHPRGEQLSPDPESTPRSSR
jgi:hypothetical protein